MFHTVAIVNNKSNGVLLSGVLAGKKSAQQECKLFLQIYKSFTGRKNS